MPTPNFGLPLYGPSDTAKLDTLLNGQSTALDTALQGIINTRSVPLWGLARRDNSVAISSSTTFAGVSLPIYEGAGIPQATNGLTLPSAGLYLVTVMMEFEANGTGRRVIKPFINGQDSGIIDVLSIQQGYGGNTNTLTATGVVQADQDAVLTMRAWQNSGSSLQSGRASLRAVKLGL